MDTELLLFLWVFWCSTTLALVAYLPMFFANRGESFHPHVSRIVWTASGRLKVDQEQPFAHIAIF